MLSSTLEWMWLSKVLFCCTTLQTLQNTEEEPKPYFNRLFLKEISLPRQSAYSVSICNTRGWTPFGSPKLIFWPNKSVTARPMYVNHIWIFFTFIFKSSLFFSLETSLIPCYLESICIFNLNNINKSPSQVLKKEFNSLFILIEAWKLMSTN